MKVSLSFIISLWTSFSLLHASTILNRTIVLDRSDNSISGYSSLASSQNTLTQSTHILSPKAVAHYMPLREIYHDDRGEECTRPLLPQGLVNELTHVVTHKRKSDEFRAKRNAQYTNAVQGFNILLRDMHYSQDDFPQLTHYFAQGEHFLLPRHVIADIFTGAETKEEIAHGILRLGMTSHNMESVQPGFSKTITEGQKHALKAFGADCYFFAAQWFHHALSSLFNDLNLLPQHRRLSESSSLTTIEGRKHALESVYSVFMMTRWAMYRLPEESERRQTLSHATHTLNALLTHYCAAHLSSMPRMDDILFQGNLLTQCADQLTRYGQAVSDKELGYALFDVGEKLVRDVLPKEGTLTPFTLKATDERITQGNLVTLLHHIHAINMSTFYGEILPRYHRFYRDIQRFNSHLMCLFPTLEEGNDEDGEGGLQGV